MHFQSSKMNAILFVGMVLTIAACAADESAKLTVNLANTGFHRDLIYRIVFPKHQTESHTFLIKQTIPAAVYVSTDQLDDLSRFNKISYHVDVDLIDIEKPTEHCQPFTIYLYGDTMQTQPISLPIHFRYHAPAHRSFVTVNIDLPRIFVELDARNDDDEIANDTAVIHLFTCPDRRHRCKWHEVEFDNYSKRSLSASIPIGNAGVSGVITFATIALSWAAAVFIIFVIRNKSKSLKIKLK